MAEPLTITDAADLEALDALAERRGTSREEALHALLVRLRDEVAATERAVPSSWDDLWRLAYAATATVPASKRTSNHDDLYDEGGLPA